MFIYLHYRKSTKQFTLFVRDKHIVVSLRSEKTIVWLLEEQKSGNKYNNIKAHYGFSYMQYGTRLSELSRPSKQQQPASR